MLNPDVDDYINEFAGITKDRVLRLREIAHAVVPNASEKISYGVPTICDEKGAYIAYFAGYKDFVSIYPVHQAVPISELERYLSGKSTARFKNSDPLPEELITQLFVNLNEAYKRRSA